MQIDARNKKGCTPLWLAANNGQLEAVQTLVKQHADVDAEDNRKVTPLIAAFRKGHLKVDLPLFSMPSILSSEAREFITVA